MRNWKFYTILFFYIFLFGSLSAAYSGFVKTESRTEFRTEVALDTLPQTFDQTIVPKVQAAAPIEEFVLVIPSIGLEHNVVENVDPRYPDEYLPVLDENIAHGKFTRMPDGALDDGNVYLFAHREWWYRGNDAGFFARLDELGAGDLAIIKYNGKTYTYKYRARKVVNVADVSVYTSEATSPTLTLQTCQGSEKRLIIWFDLVEVE